MKKIILQGLVLVLGFFLLWFGFSQIDFVKIFKIKEHNRDIESSLGDMIWKDIAQTEDVITNDSLVKTLDKLVNPLCEANHIDRDSLKIHLIRKDEINAFALPNNHLVVYTGLIEDCKKQQALQGVLGHEIAHIENKHVMKKLSKEIGFSVLLTATTGDRGGQLIKEVLKSLSSSAYDRSLEKEADMASVDYMIKADIDPKPMADFMYQMAQENTMPDALVWIADHPESEERAKYILEYIGDRKTKSKPSITEKDWENFKKTIKEE